MQILQSVVFNGTFVLSAAERSLQLRLEERLLTAAREGDNSELKKLVSLLLLAIFLLSHSTTIIMHFVQVMPSWWHRVCTYNHVQKWPICLALLLSLQIDSVHPPNINCQDMVGNTPLHCAAYR